jgi:hypothetical protein
VFGAFLAVNPGVITVLVLAAVLVLLVRGE